MTTCDNFDIYNIGCNSSLFEHCYRVITSWAAENDCMNNECVFNIRFFEKDFLARTQFLSLAKYLTNSLYNSDVEVDNNHINNGLYTIIKFLSFERKLSVNFLILLLLRNIHPVIDSKREEIKKAIKENNDDIPIFLINKIMSPLLSNKNLVNLTSITSFIENVKICAFPLHFIDDKLDFIMFVLNSIYLIDKVDDTKLNRAVRDWFLSTYISMWCREIKYLSTVTIDTVNTLSLREKECLITSITTRTNFKLSDFGKDVIRKIDYYFPVDIRTIFDVMLTDYCVSDTLKHFFKSRIESLNVKDDKFSADTFYSVIGTKYLETLQELNIGYGDVVEIMNKVNGKTSFKDPKEILYQIAQYLNIIKSIREQHDIDKGINVGTTKNNNKEIKEEKENKAVSDNSMINNSSSNDTKNTIGVVMLTSSKNTPYHTDIYKSINLYDYENDNLIGHYKDDTFYAKHDTHKIYYFGYNVNCNKEEIPLIGDVVLTQTIEGLKFGLVVTLINNKNFATTANIISRLSMRSTLKEIYGLLKMLRSSAIDSHSLKEIVNLINIQ